MGLGAIFSIPFPPIYTAATEAIGGLVQIELPAMMPVDCIIRTSYYSKLIFKTVWPLLFYLVFGIAAKVQRRKGKDGAADSHINMAFLIMFIVYPGAPSRFSPTTHYHALSPPPLAPFSRLLVHLLRRLLEPAVDVLLRAKRG